MITINVRHFHYQDSSTDALLRVLIKKVDTIMTTQVEHAAQLAAISAQFSKAKAEIVSKIATLTDAVAAAASVSPEVQAATDALATLAQQFDDIEPDPAPTPDPAPEEPAAG